MELLMPETVKGTFPNSNRFSQNYQATKLLEMPTHQKLRSIRRKKRRSPRNRFTKKQDSGAEETPSDVPVDEENLGPSTSYLSSNGKPNSIQ